MKPKVSVIIPSWNGERLLRKNLPLVIKALPNNTEIIVVDNGSTDRSRRYLEKFIRRQSSGRNSGETSLPSAREISGIPRLTRETEFPSISAKPRLTGRSKFHGLTVIFNDRNLGFIKACNQGVKAAKGDFVVLLNNDVIPEKDFLESALKHFKSPDIFAVTFNERQYGWAKIWWRFGFIHHGVGGQGKQPHISGWANGGSAVFRRSMWKKLNGFDELYEPFFWEDFDLGYRAWKNGWKIIWEPKAVVEHRHESTISKLDRAYVNLVKERNQLLFVWKNINNFRWRLTNVLGIMIRCFFGPNYIKVVIAAVKRYLECGRPRVEEKTLTDEQVVGLFKWRKKK